MRGGLTIVAGVLTGNVLGVGRVALIAYLLGTHSYADSLAVAMGPLDTLNSVLINSIVFAFVPMLTAAQGEERTALFLKLTRGFVWVFSLISPERDAGRALAHARPGARPRSAILRHVGQSPADSGALHRLRRRGRGPLRHAVHRPALRPGGVLPGRAQRLHHRRRAVPVEVRRRLRLRHRLHRGRLGATGHRLFRRAFRPGHRRRFRPARYAGARF